MWEFLEEPGASDDAHGVGEDWRGKHAARHPELAMIIQPAGEMFIARCPELGIACRGYSEEDARANLAQDVEIFFEAAEQAEEFAAGTEHCEGDSDEADGMRPEYDFSGGVRGKYRQQLTAIVEREGREGNGFVSLYPELDIASQGDTPEEACGNVAEALEWFFEAADESEVRRRLEH